MLNRFREHRPRSFSKQSAFGQDRGFHQRYGYHADIVRPKVTETFPSGWEARLLSMEGLDRAYCLEPHDMAAGKCLVGREKDAQQLAWLLREKRLDEKMLRERINLIEISVEQQAKCHTFLDDLLAGH